MATLDDFSRQVADIAEQAAAKVVTVVTGGRFHASAFPIAPGVLVTAEHSLRRAETVEIVLPSGSSAEATVLGRDAGTDVAVLKAAGAPEPFAQRAKAPRAGDLVLAVGRHPEHGAQVSMGVFSAAAGAARSMRGGRLDAIWKLDLNLYPGMSGAVVVDATGALLGMASPALSRVIPMAVPGETLDRIAGNITSKGFVSRGYLGVGLQPIETGLIILSVEQGSSAAEAGLFVGDILVKAGGHVLSTPEDLLIALEDAAGKRVEFDLVRGGQPQSVSVTVGERHAR